ncbi:BrnT family toxin [Desulfocurvibacter africanus]|uniref:BrnT family toxin n=2 Tax=Desulfocurvibacter africanus TaxID=873 RepID=F3YZR6_DESAF|nr:BrnT family toxin [Desulfocurvibacter africanus]EGJ50871.1 protein of unknown function DUF497 [Desulfocurvibacter africanus subsp. africanus str. Walvis Bay]
MRYEWDQNKRGNLEKHGIDFLDAIEVLEGSPLMREDDRSDY